MITIFGMVLAIAVAIIIVLVNIVYDEYKTRERYEKWFCTMKDENKVLRGTINEYKTNFRDLKQKYEDALYDLEEAKMQHNIDEWEIGHLEHQLDMAEDHIMRMHEDM